MNSTLTFQQLGLHPKILKAVSDLGFEKPTDVQRQAIPAILEGRDVAGASQTGTGKTAAFALPILCKLLSKWTRPQKGFCRCLILEPTRELAAQVHEACLTYLPKNHKLNLALVYGGVGFTQQRDAIDRGADIVVATPGRLLDHISEKTLKLGKVEFLVLDEVDRMLDIGFMPDVKKIVRECPTERQTLLFTATLPPEIENLASFALKDPVKVEIGAQRRPAETIEHAFYPVASDQKFDLLMALLKHIDSQTQLIFCRTKHGADRVCGGLQNAGFASEVMHSDRSQKERERALQGFKDGTFKILVATEVAARGLHIDGVTHVINYDVPENPEDYVHRIGRTGRAEQTGVAMSLVVGEEAPLMDSIEKYIGASIERKKLEGFEYRYTALLDPQIPAMTKGSIRGGRTYKGYSFGARKRR
ncbi:MAG: DEAD/DEAH box helicase [Verrucomicrobiales bacterium]